MIMAIGFIRSLFILMNILFMILATSHPMWGLGLGVGIGALFIGFDQLFRRLQLRIFNLAVLGLFVGYLMGKALLLSFSAVLEVSAPLFLLDPLLKQGIETGLFLFGLYLGTLVTLRSSDDFYLSIPFVRLNTSMHQKKDLLIDSSVLSDARIVDLCASGLVDENLVVPSFLIQELLSQVEASDEAIRSRAKRALDILKKLQAMSSLALKTDETDFQDIKDPMGKLVRLARLINANLLTADFSRVQTSHIEGIKIINIHTLSNALKPLMQTGEHIRIKIQRYGKEPRQGVGYLEDGTMVVVNGGGQYIGDTIDAHVLSVKHTSTGRMIFCNAEEEASVY